MDNAPIGVFDSGMGGLSVWREIVRRLPHESILYYGDGANCPYGDKSREQIVERSETIVRFFIDRGVKLVVVACNTATAAAIDALRAGHPEIPFVGMEPAVKVATQNSRSGVIAILATAATLGGRLFRETSERHGAGVRIIPAVGNDFVELVEAAREDSPAAEQAVRRALEPLLAEDIDHIVLGCSHYPFLAPTIERVLAGRPITLVDPAPAVAGRVETILNEQNRLSGQDRHPNYAFYSSADENYRRRLQDRGERILTEIRL